VVVGVNDITNQVPVAQALKYRGEIAIWLEAHAGVAEVLFPALPEMERFSIAAPAAGLVGRGRCRSGTTGRRRAGQATGRSHSRGLRTWPMDGLLGSDLMAADGFHPGPVCTRGWRTPGEVIERDVARQAGTD